MRQNNNISSRVSACYPNVFYQRKKTKPFNRIIAPQLLIVNCRAVVVFDMLYRFGTTYCHLRTCALASGAAGTRAANRSTLNFQCVSVHKKQILIDSCAHECRTSKKVKLIRNYRSQFFVSAWNSAWNFQACLSTNQNACAWVGDVIVGVYLIRTGFRRY